jgi:adenine deaminase
LARAIQIKGDIVTAERFLELPVHDGRLVLNPDAGVWTVAAFDRHGRGRLTAGVVLGFGRRDGAAASSLTFDTADVVVVGSHPEIMVRAARAVLQAGGGFSIVRAGRTELLPLPVGGVVSARPVPEIAAGFAAIRSSLRAFNPDLTNPLLTLQTLTFSAIPALRITSSGLVDVKGNRRVDLLVES